LRKKCYYFENTKIVEPVQVGVNWLFSTAKNFDGAWFAVNVLENLRTISEQYPGLSMLQTLENPTFKSNINQIDTYLITDDRIPPDGKNMPLLVVHPREDYLRDLDKISNIPEMMVIPWASEEVEDWINNSKAVLYGSEDNDEEIDYEKIDPRVLLALEQMTKDFNGITNHIAESTARKLLDMSLDFNPSIIRKILIKKFSWEHDEATLASEFMANIRDGKKSLP
jgi:hypothetical protein